MLKTGNPRETNAMPDGVKFITAYVDIAESRISVEIVDCG
ncbi:phage terminase large subunit family protein [Sulfitobacter sp. W074]|nr:phage terminase large subunit family protein [Sulfitobacter sp. W074]UWR38378.1 phage terminase large subunit family protein [Sulfitobacter sp. W074]